MKNGLEKQVSQLQEQNKLLKIAASQTEEKLKQAAQKIKQDEQKIKLNEELIKLHEEQIKKDKEAQIFTVPVRPDETDDIWCQERAFYLQ